MRQDGVKEMKLNKASISAALPPSLKGLAITVTEMTVSTNNDAKEYFLRGGRETALFVSDEQSGGRGRLGHTFHSPKGCGIYMTLAIPMDNIERAASLTPAAAVAVLRSIEKLTHKRPMIKWVNDILLDGRKLCGILCEAVSGTGEGSMGAVVGIGMNFRSVPFPDDLKDIVCALDYDESLTREMMIAQIVKELLSLVSVSNSDDVMDEYRRRSLVLGKDITYTKNGVTLKAKALSIGKGGELTVLNENGERDELSGGGIRILSLDS